MTKILLAILAALLMGSVGQAGEYQWRKGTDSTARWYLWQNGIQVGGYDVAGGYYRPLLANGDWGNPCDPPLKPPEGEIAKNQGVDRWRLRRGEEHASLNGAEVEVAQAIAAIDGRYKYQAGVPADGNLPFVVATGPDAKRVEQDWLSAPALAPFRSSHRFQAYDLDDAMAKDRDGKEAYVRSPGTVYLLAADGKVLSRLRSYAGPEALAEAIRKAKPYVPNQDPDPNAPIDVGGGLVIPLLFVSAGTLLLIALAAWGLGALVFAFRS